MIRRWIAERRSLVASTVSGLVVAVLIGTIAVVSGGYEAQRLDLGDGSVWAANSSAGAVGRANTEILALDTVVSIGGSDLEVLQDVANVLVVDHTDNTVDVVDQATAVVLDRVPLPPQSPEVHLAAGVVVVHAVGTGEIWLVPAGDFGGFDSQSEPTFTFGPNAVASVDPQGELFVYSVDAQQVYRVDTATETVTTAAARFGEPGDDFQISSVAGRWVLLDRSRGRLSIEGREVDLTDRIADFAGAQLQSPSERGDRILVAHSEGLVETTVAGSAPVELTETAGGNAAGGAPTSAVAPLVDGDCAFAAWSSGTAWRECGGESETMQLDGVRAGATGLVLLERGDRVALSDPQSGVIWAVQAGGEAIANWDELIADEQAQEEVEENDQDVEPEFETDQVPPSAVDDEFGARPGRASILPVLLNDYDPNGDVLVISDVGQLDSDIGRLDIVNNRQQVQLTLAPTASGVFSFGYTVDDGRGGTDSATVTVTVRQPDENGAPEQVRRARDRVGVGGSVTTSVLGEWVDPDGDAVYLASAAVAEPDAVTYRPQGTVVFTEANGNGETRSVGLVVSDGSAQGTGELLIGVDEPGTVRLTAEKEALTAYAGQELSVAPLRNVRGGSGDYRLSSVPSRPGSAIEASLEAGTFRFTSDQVRVHFIDYVVTDGSQTITGELRIDVLAPPDVNTPPITVPQTVFVRSQSTETIDVASTDIDPAGGVLMVTAVDELPPDSGVGLEILDQRAIRVTLLGPLDGPITFGYRITNGLAVADGAITVVEIPLPTRFQPPVAVDDTVTVRVGDAIDIPVLANDEQPDGEDLTLDQELVTSIERAGGLLFASGDVLRYLAPNRTGNFTAVYQVRGPDGQSGQAEVRIAVREAVVATNAPPVPRQVTARVLAGETVRIPIPLAGIDPDGDSVQLLGQETNPQKGSVTSSGADYIEYLAGEYSAGTDTFTYSVIDALGARATGTVRVGIAPPTEGPRNPVAVLDEVSVRPGKTVSVQVLENDSDPEGRPLTVVAVEPNSSDIAAEIIDGEIVDVTPPAAEGQYGLVYTIENSLGGTSSNFIRVIVDDAAPPSYPSARDTVLTLSDVLGRDVIEVDVLRNVFFAEGPVSSLDLSLLDGYDEAATVTPRNRISVSVQQQRQIIPFAVANPDDATRVSYAFVWVPGLADALPQLDRTVRSPSVVSESPLTIDLNDYVIAVGGRRVQLADATSVQATNANGAQLVVNSRTLRFTSAAGYFGPASISFEVTDGTSADDPDGRRATLVLPITVTPRENQPPVFTGGVLDLEPGQERTLDLRRLTTYGDPNGLDRLRYTPIGDPPAGFSYRITGAQLVITANPQAQRGSSSVLTLGVRDSVADGQAGRLQLNVVASTRPLARPASDLVVAPRGQTTTVDVLANDEATNPFPGTPLRVLGIRGLDGANLPAGISIAPSADNRRLSVTVAQNAPPVDTTLQYQVADATDDPGRYVFGSVRVSVQDRPDTPLPPVRADGGFDEGQLTLRLAAPVSNNSPITGYVVTSSSNGVAYRHECGTQLRCVLTDLVAGRRYQFQVVAVNAVGASEPSASSIELSADYLPAAPGAVTVTASRSEGGPALDVNWSAVPNPARGSAVSGYVVRLQGPGVDSMSTVNARQTGVTVTAAAGVQSGAQYVATVYARNAALVLSDTDWRRTVSAPTTAVGPPTQVSGLTATSVGTSGQIQVTWAGSDPNGGALAPYRIVRLSAGAAAPECSASVGQEAASPYIDQGARDGASYSYAVYSRNALFCTVTVSQPVESRSAPGVAAGTTVIEGRESGRWDLRAGNDLTVSRGTAVRFEVNVQGRGWRPVERGTWLTSAENSLDYGTPLTVSYRGCRDATPALCGEPSPAQTLVPVNARAGIVSCVVGQAVTPSPPQNTGSVSVRYEYQFNTGLGWGGSTAFGEDAVAPEPVEGATTSVRVKAAVTVGGEPERLDQLWAESSCTAPQ